MWQTGRTSEVPARPSASDGVLDLGASGARGDGVSLVTSRLQTLVDEAGARGGGTVVVPAGRWLCGSVHLQSHVTLRLAQGAVLIAADPGHFDAAEPNAWSAFQDFGHSHWHNSLLWGDGLHDVVIEGPGRIWGRGLTRGENAERTGVGNKCIALVRCHNVRLQGFGVLHGGHFAILASGVDNLTIDSLLIDTNRDGMDIDCCRNVHVSNCTVNSPWDDAIVLKTSYALGTPRPTESVTVSGCTVCGGWREGTLLDGTFEPVRPSDEAWHSGRIKLGTESTGAFRGIAVTACTFVSCQGIAVESVDGAVIEDVTFSGITMHDVHRTPIFIRLGRRMRAPAGTPVGAIRRVTIDDVNGSSTASDAPVVVSGVPGHAVEDLTLSHIRFTHAAHSGAPGAIPPEREDAYPDTDMFDPLPAQGFFMRHARNVSVDHVTIGVDGADTRPASVLVDVDNLEYDHVSVPGATGSDVLQGVTRFVVP